jgi:hypothetical protein
MGWRIEVMAIEVMAIEEGKLEGSEKVLSLCHFLFFKW